MLQEQGRSHAWKNVDVKKIITRVCQATTMANTTMLNALCTQKCLRSTRNEVHTIVMFYLRSVPLLRGFSSKRKSKDKVFACTVVGRLCYDTSYCSSDSDVSRGPTAVPQLCGKCLASICGDVFHIDRVVLENNWML